MKTQLPVVGVRGWSALCPENTGNLRQTCLAPELPLPMCAQREICGLVIGIGWNSNVRVDPAVKNIKGAEVHILPTPQAFELFNRCVSEGRRVVLIAHSTC